jgi:hypothetical protein
LLDPLHTASWIAVDYLLACYKIIAWLECGTADGLVALTPKEVLTSYMKAEHANIAWCSQD